MAYAGPWPVVAHPPCGPWGKLRHLYRGQEHACALRAVEQVNQFGGVLEHPAGSLLWDKCSLPRPDLFGLHGFTVEVDQVHWGHVAKKRTWLYVVGLNYGEVKRAIRAQPRREPTHWVSGRRGERRSGGGGWVVPPGIKVCSAEQRRRTPRPFAEWLIELAEQAGARRAIRGMG
jgi:hypothetical protein